MLPAMTTASVMALGKFLLAGYYLVLAYFSAFETWDSCDRAVRGGGQIDKQLPLGSMVCL